MPKAQNYKGFQSPVQGLHLCPLLVRTETLTNGRGGTSMPQDGSRASCSCGKQLKTEGPSEGAVPPGKS